jgi:hypothetical protein
MARTLSGSLTGAAAREEARDLAEANYEAWVREERQKLMSQESALLDQAVELPGFDEFWEGVPVFGTMRSRISALEQFITSHKNDSPPTDGRTA